MVKKVCSLFLMIVLFTACLPPPPPPTANANQTIGSEPQRRSPDVYLPLVSREEVEVVAASALFLNAGESATIHCIDGILAASGQTDFSIDLLCVPFTPTPTATDTATPTPTDTATPTNTPTDTPTPTFTPTDTPTDTPIPPTATHTPVPPNATPAPPNANAPYCPDQIDMTIHDRTKWHSIWDSSRGCWYEHDHGDDPKTMNDIFGPLTGQEISYPHQTFSGADFNYGPIPSDPAKLENNLKHEGYFWSTARNIPCDAGQRLCIRAFRIQEHIRPDLMDAAASQHSQRFEFLVEERNAAGQLVDTDILIGGGWNNYDELMIDNVHIILPSDPPTRLQGRQRLHRWGTGLFSQTSNRDATWYGVVGGIVFMATNFETLSALEPINPAAGTIVEHFFCSAYGPLGGNPADCNTSFRPWLSRQDGSKRMIHRLSLTLNDNLDGVTNGRAHYVGFRDRYGKAAPNCTQVGLDCIYWQIDDLPTGNWQMPENQGVVQLGEEAEQLGIYRLRWPMNHYNP